MNAFCERLGLTVPLIQAPMAGVSTPALAVAVSQAGALGSFATGAIASASVVAQHLVELQAATDKPLNINLFCHHPAPVDPQGDAQWLAYLQPFFASLHHELPLQLAEIYPSFTTNEALLAVLLQTPPQVISFHFGLPSATQLVALRQTGALLLACVTSLAEARIAERAGVDVLIAQGVEAGGHRGTFDPTLEPGLSTLALTRQVVQTCALPVIAAGGLMDGADLAAALQAGAVAGQLGTAFVACPESAASESYRAALLQQPSLSTALTSVISGRSARGIINKFMQEVDQPGRPAVAAYSRAYVAGKALVAAAQQMGDPGFAVQWAGTGLGRSRALPAAELVRTLAAELQYAMGKASSPSSSH